MVRCVDAGSLLGCYDGSVSTSHLVYCPQPSAPELTTCARGVALSLSAATRCFLAGATSCCRAFVRVACCVSILRHAVTIVVLGTGEIALANESEGGGVVVVLSERAKIQMEADIASSGVDLLGTQVVCRSGDACCTLIWLAVLCSTVGLVFTRAPFTASEALFRVSAQHARAIVVLSQPVRQRSDTVSRGASVCGLM